VSTIKFLWSAAYDLSEAINSIREYFLAKELPNLAETHIEKFFTELDAKLGTLKEHPKMYRVRKDGAFADTIEDFRIFTVHWFTVFYTYDDDGHIIVWYIRSAVSDFSKVSYLFPR
jgi:plasmid stabilization system protein ParE